MRILIVCSAIVCYALVSMQGVAAENEWKTAEQQEEKIRPKTLREMMNESFAQSELERSPELDVGKEALKEMIDEYAAEVQFRWFAKTDMFDVDAGLVGSAENIGLEESRLIDSVKSCLKKEISDIPVSKHSRQGSDAIGISDSLAYMSLRVWTFGENDPIAYHVRLRCYRRPDGEGIRFFEIYDDELLGYTTVANINEATDDAISEMIENFAFIFRCAREGT